MNNIIQINSLVRSGTHVAGWLRYAFLFLLFLGWGLVSNAQNSKEVRKMKAQRSELKKQIGESEQLLRSTKKDVASQLNNLVLLDAQILERQQYVDRLAYDADSLDKAILVQKKNLKELEAELTACKANYRRAMTFVSRNKMKQSRWMFVLMAKDFRQLYRRLRYASQYSKYQKAQGEMIQRKELEVREKQQQLTDAKKEKEGLLVEGRTQKADLEKKKAERQEMVKQLGEKQRSIQKVINRDKRKYSDLNVRIDRLIKAEIAAAERRRKEAERKRREAEERRRREEEAERRRQASAQKSAGKSHSGKAKKHNAPSSSPSRTATPKFNAADDMDAKLNSDFASNRGRLPVPISGGYTITSRYGTYNVEGLRGVRLENKGINITGHRGAQARSIFNGEVVAVVNLDGSYTVIVRHGSYYSVYANLSSVSVRNGQKVSTSQHLGTVAVDGSGNCVLHFQLRRNTTTLNPQSWIR